MIVYPAIDIRAGRCVRLIEGDFDRETVFDADPVAAARRWADRGAEWLHVVDLDGAVAGHPVNLDAIGRIRSAVAIPIQLGGGLRSQDHLGSVFDLGIDRAVLGTAALRDRSLIEAAVDRWGERIAVGLDARDGKLAANGWLDQSDVPTTEAALALQIAGVRRFVFTDIRRDGTLTGPNLGALRELIAAVDAAVIASGGVGGLHDIAAVAATGAEGVIVGRALYDGRLDLGAAIDTGRGTTQEALR